MSDELKLTLDRKEGKDPGRKGLQTALLVILVVLFAARLYFVIDARMAGRGEGPHLGEAKLEELALKLERQHLGSAAAGAWLEYMEAARPGPEETAGILYRTGKLYQEAGEYEKALDAYYRSESVSKTGEIEAEMSARISECLERLGRFAALRSELESRTALDQGAKTPGMEVLAEIGSWKITRSDLESMIEAEIDAELSQYAGSLPPEQLKNRRQELLDEVLKEGQQAAWLERFIAEELVYRQAMEDRLYDDAGYRAFAKHLERKMLIQKRLEMEYAERVQISDQEMQGYFDANKEKFREDGRQKGFEESAPEVYSILRRQKEQQVQADFIKSLREKADVVVHGSLTGRQQ